MIIDFFFKFLATSIVAFFNIDKSGSLFIFTGVGTAIIMKSARFNLFTEFVKIIFFDLIKLDLFTSLFISILFF